MQRHFYGGGESSFSLKIYDFFSGYILAGNLGNKASWGIHIQWMAPRTEQFQKRVPSIVLLASRLGKKLLRECLVPVL
jgi:hypothetical protein